MRPNNNRTEIIFAVGLVGAIGIAWITVVLHGTTVSALFSDTIRRPLTRADLLAIINILILVGGFYLAWRQLRTIEHQNATSIDIERAENLIARDKDYESEDHSLVRKRFQVLHEACARMVIADHFENHDSLEDLQHDDCASAPGSWLVKPALLQLPSGRPPR